MNGPFLLAVAAFIVFWLISFVLFRFHPFWWEKKYLRKIFYGILICGLLGNLLWFTGSKLHNYTMMNIGSGIAGFFLLGQFTLVVSFTITSFMGIMAFLISRLFRLIRKMFTREHNPSAPQNPANEINYGRRKVLSGTLAIIPLAAFGLETAGFIKSYTGPDIKDLKFRFPEIPDGLKGMKIIQISDLHLGHYTHLKYFEKAAADIETYNPDIVLITGDFCDDVESLPQALEIVSQIKTTCGTYSCMGNHEYFRMSENREALNHNSNSKKNVADRCREIYGNAGVKLFVNEGTFLKFNDTEFYLGGIDDPVRLSTDFHGFFEEAIIKTMAGVDKDTFSIMMSHRPSSFDIASYENVNLILAGHTHGSQIGIGEKSILEAAGLSTGYLWGHYQISNSQLYTTCGAGHWFPFRLGCPTEIPLITIV